MDEVTETDEGIVQAEIGTLELLAPESAGALDRAQIDVQIATAKRYPRSVTKSINEATELATYDEETAASCYYVLPRGGRRIQGPSARLAEIMLFSWGNARAEADIVSEDRRYVTAVGTCFDLERNVATRIRVKRRITDKHGKRYDEDMIGVTSNAAVSIAFRNAVLKCIPRSFTDRVYKAAQLASTGKGTLEGKRTKALEYFGQNGIKPEQVYQMLGVHGLDDIGIDEIIVLRGVVNAIREGETTLELVFNPPKETAEAQDLDKALGGEDD